MNAYRMLLVQPALEHRLANYKRFTVALAAGALLNMLATLAGMVTPRTGAIIFLCLAGIGFVLWWGIFLANAVRQNTPTQAVLVPGLRRRLMTLTALLWGAASVLPALLFGSVIGHSGYVLLGGAVLLLFIACAQRFLWIIMPFALLTQVAKEPLAQAFIWWASAGEAVATLGALAVLLPCAAWLLVTLFPRGGDRHRAWRDKADLRAARMKKGLETGAERGRLGAFLGRPARTIHARSIAHAPAAGRRATHLLYGLGPRMHWSQMVGAMALHALTGVAWMAWARPAMPAQLGYGLSMLLVLPLLLGTRMLTAALADTKAEQALLRLAPAAPAAQRLNRELALALLRQFGIVWAGYLVLSAMLASYLAPAAPCWPAWCCTAALAAAMALPLLRDYARAPVWRSFNIVLGITFVAWPVLVLVLPHLPSALLYGASIVCLLAVAAALRGRWKRMAACAPAWPAGRLAEA